MIELEVDVFFLLYLGAGFLLIFGLWFYYDRRDKNLHEAKRMKAVYHCIKCSEIYTGSHLSFECECPRCGFTNGRLGF
ncbi:MAG: hydrogenase nickel incorporation protein HypA [Opitutales bacterium]